ncbi:MAG: Gfo/Idh/MocA family oxidoreductase [Firmicutes bacterium]|nr:Gfo/Idh/MocA family oxidoreductase [Bacillota bacterium]
MKQKLLKAGVVGCGGIANGKHMPSVKAAGGVEFTAFCDIILERAEKSNKDFGGGKGKVFEDYRDLVREDLDMVYVCTPNCSHCEITVAALLAGKHVMCEKPMAMNYAEAKKMLDAKNKSGKLLTVGYQGRYRPDTLFLKRECNAGGLGEIYFAKAYALRRRAVPTWGVFTDEEKQGGGPLIDIGTHALVLALFMMNNYEPAYAVGTTYHKLNKMTETGNAWGDWDPEKFTAEDSAFGFVVMKNGATVSLESSWALNIADPQESTVTLCGTKAGADMKDGLRLNGVMHGRQYVTKPDFNAGGVAFYAGKNLDAPGLEAATFINAVSGKGELYVEPEQAAVVTQILEGIYNSAKTGKPHVF